MDRDDVLVVSPSSSLATVVLLTGISALLVGAGAIASALRSRSGGEVPAGPAG